MRASAHHQDLRQRRLSIMNFDINNIGRDILSIIFLHSVRLFLPGVGVLPVVADNDDQFRAGPLPFHPAGHISYFAQIYV
jgi:hypothetical protein